MNAQQHGDAQRRRAQAASAQDEMQRGPEAPPMVQMDRGSSERGGA